jgi:hypothetical protein
MLASRCQLPERGQGPRNLFARCELAQRKRWLGRVSRNLAQKLPQESARQVAGFILTNWDLQTCVEGVMSIALRSSGGTRRKGLNPIAEKGSRQKNKVPILRRG